MRSDVPHISHTSAGSSPLTLEDLGWQPGFGEYLPSDTRDLILGRVAITFRDRARVIAVEGELEARFSTGMSRDNTPPAAGDWVLLAVRSGQTYAVIQQILPRRTAFSRKVAGEVSAEQVVAANVDTVLLVEPCQGLNTSRLERTLVAAWSSGATPVIVLSKSDLCPKPEAQRSMAERTGRGVPVHAISVRADAGIDGVLEYCRRGQTIALIGSSGAGKSTLVNRLVGSEVARTGDVRSHDGRGRHTTTHRELMRLPSGGLIIDTPGLRELQLWDAHEGIARAFDDVVALAGKCRFRDCQHGSEQDCAVQHAIAIKELDPARLQSFQKLDREQQHQEARFDQRLRAQTKQRDRVLHRQMRDYHPRD